MPQHRPSQQLSLSIFLGRLQNLAFLRFPTPQTALTLGMAPIFERFGASAPSFCDIFVGSWDLAFRGCLRHSE
jgi:hypothetical protein